MFRTTQLCHKTEMEELVAPDKGSKLEIACIGHPPIPTDCTLDR